MWPVSIWTISQGIEARLPTEVWDPYVRKIT